MSIASTISGYIKTKLRGTTPSGNPTSFAADANTQGLHVGSMIGSAAQLASANPITTQNRPWNALNVSPDPTGVFLETFDTALDTINKWISTTGSGGSLASVVGGIGSIVAGAAVSGYSKLITIPAFVLSVQSYLSYVNVIQLDATITANNYRFFGAGTSPTVPTITAAVTDGVGFEISSAGVLSAVVWSNGVKTFSQILTRPTDGAYHRYAVFYKTSRVYWFIDNLDNYVATVATTTTSYTPPVQSALPTLLISVNDPTTAPTVNAVASTAVKFNCQVTNVGDFGRNSMQISDTALPFRGVQVGRNGGLSVKGSTTIGVSGTIVAGATGTIGPVDVSEAGNVTIIIKNTIAANPYAGNPVLVFEQSDDNVSWGPLNITRSDTGATNTTFTLSANTANASLAFDAAMEAINFVRVRVTTGPLTNAITINIQSGGMPFSPVVSVVQQPLIKGTQGISGVTTQDLKDSGRSLVTYYMLLPVLASATDTLQSMTGTKGDVTVAATTTQAVVTAGKRFRVTRFAAQYISTTTVGYVIVRLRYAIGGLVTITSPVAFDILTGNASASATTANSVGMSEVSIPDGLEFAAGVGTGVSVIGLAGLTATANGYVKVIYSGYEY